MEGVATPGEKGKKGVTAKRERERDEDGSRRWVCCEEFQRNTMSDMGVKSWC